MKKMYEDEYGEENEDEDDDNLDDIDPEILAAA